MNRRTFLQALAALLPGAAVLPKAESHWKDNLPVLDDVRWSAPSGGHMTFAMDSRGDSEPHMKFRLSVSVNEEMVAGLALAARQCVRAGVLSPEEASIALVEAVELEVIDESDDE